MIDKVDIYDTALSSSQIEEHARLCLDGELVRKFECCICGVSFQATLQNRNRTLLNSPKSETDRHEYGCKCPKCATEN